MSEENAAQEQQQAEPTGAVAATEPQVGQPEKVTDLSMVDDKVLASFVDKRVSEALKTRERKIQEAEEAKQKEAERKALEEKGEYDKVLSQLKQEREQLEMQMKVQAVDYALSTEAMKPDTKLHDPSDLKLLSADVVNGCLNDDGTVNAEAVKAALVSLKEAKPHLFDTGEPPKQQRGQASPGDAAPSAPTMGTGNLTVDQFVQLHNRKLDAARNPKPDGSAMAALQALIGKGK
jgi:hypothetical protein